MESEFNRYYIRACPPLTEDGITELVIYRETRQQPSTGI
jgi:hypothetical protein